MHGFMKLFVWKRRKWWYLFLSYIDDFIVACSAGRESTAMDCREGSKGIDDIMRKLGLTRYPTKMVWGEGLTLVEHLGLVWN